MSTLTEVIAKKATDTIDKVSFVSTIGIKNAAYSTDEIRNKVSEQINNILNKIKNINSKCELHQKYNNTFASAKESFNHYIPGTTNQIEYVQVNWSTWQTSGAETISKELDIAGNLFNDLSYILDDMGILVDQSLLSAESIEKYNKMVDETIAAGTATSGELLKVAFESLKHNITWDEYSAANGNWEGVKEENEQWWTDKLLRFKYDEKTGSYLVEQQDDEGNWVGMGWTNKETALAYIDAFDKEQKGQKHLKIGEESENKEGSENNDEYSESKTQSIITDKNGNHYSAEEVTTNENGEKIVSYVDKNEKEHLVNATTKKEVVEKSDGSYVQKENAKTVQVDEVLPSEIKSQTDISSYSVSAQKEVASYAATVGIKGENSKEANQLYNEMSQEGKNLWNNWNNGNVTVNQAPINSIETAVNNHESIHIPKGQHLYVDGKMRIGTDTDMVYDSITGTYKMQSKSGVLSQESISLYDMSKSEIK